MCLIAVLGKGNRLEYLILPSVSTETVEHASILNMTSHSLPAKSMKDNNCWWKQWLSTLHPRSNLAKFWSLLRLPTQHVAHIKEQNEIFSWWMTLGGLWTRTAAQRQDAMPNFLHNGFSYFVTHLSLLSFLNDPPMTRSNMTWQIDLDSHLMSPSMEQSLFTMSQTFVTKEMRGGNAISRDAAKIQTGLWSIENVQ